MWAALKTQRLGMLYDPQSDTWTPPESVPGFYRAQAGTRLADGRVLVLGGNFPSGAPIAAIYGPSGWTRTAIALGAIFDAGMATLPSGRVLTTSRSLAAAAIYDATVDTWAPGPSRLFEYPTSFSPNPVRLAPTPDGALLVDQGLNRFSSAERFYEP